MKKILGLLLLISTIVIYGKEVDYSSLKNIDEVYYQEDHQRFTGKGIIKYSNGKICLESEFDNGKVKKVTGYYQSGRLKGYVGFKEDKFNGVFKKYYENGQIQESGIYQNGKLHGRSKYYNSDGKITKEIVYQNGEIISEMNY